MDKMCVVFPSKDYYEQIYLHFTSQQPVSLHWSIGVDTYIAKSAIACKSLTTKLIFSSGIGIKYLIINYSTKITFHTCSCIKVFAVLINAIDDHVNEYIISLGVSKTGNTFS